MRRTLVRTVVPAFVFSAVAVLAVAPSAVAGYKVGGDGRASGRAETLTPPKPLWTTKSGTCGLDYGGSMISFKGNQPGVQYVIHEVQRSYKDVGSNFYPITVVTSTSGELTDVVVKLDPAIHYLYVRAEIGNWRANSYVVGCTATKPGAPSVKAPDVIPYS
jgi:hypothetical protein